MKLLDWYLLRRFSVVLIYAILSFLLVVIFVDMVGNLAKFIDKSVPKLVILKYYLFSIPYIVILILPISMLLASLFSLGQMAKYHELTAIKSVGVSLYRILFPILLLSFFISLISLQLNNNLVSASNQKKTVISERFLNPSKKRSSQNNLFWRDSQNRRVYIGRYDHRSQTAHKVSIQKYSGNQIVERIDAKKMKWQDQSWVLYNGFKRTFSHDREEARPFETYTDHFLDFNPEQLLSNRVAPEDMSYQELREFINEVLKNGGDPKRWLVDLHFKFSMPFAGFIMVLFGAPLASNRKSSGAIVGIIISVLIWVIYFAVTRFVQTLGQIGTLKPMIAAWSPNVIFVTIGLILLIHTKK